MQIRDIINKFTADLPSQPRTKVPEVSDTNSGHQVILTGSTGSLGSYILSSLLGDDSISRVFCLNRAKDGKARQMESFTQKGLCLDLLATGKTEFLQVDFAKDNLGLPPSTYTDLLDQVDTIVHNAWEVNWLLPLELFEDTHIRGVRSLIDFALQSPQHPHLAFVSSISTVYRWGGRYSTPVPEALVDDCEISLEMGYPQSKYVAEQIIKTASSQCGLKSSVLRMGQISGPTTAEGMWSLGDILPSLLATSIALGKMPMLSGEGGSIDWVPSDMGGKIVTELVYHRQRDPLPLAVFNVVNPTPVPWTLMASTIQEMYDVEVVSMASWLKSLKQVVSSKNSDRYPAIKLIDLFGIWLGGRLILPLRIENSLTRSGSTTLDSLPPVNRDWMLNWLKQWDLFPELMLYG